MTDMITAGGGQASVSTELAMRRTGMSFQRTRMAADRTMMAVLRTSLSLISFGFTIYQFFNKLKESGVLHGAASTKNFGIALILIGMGLLVLGIIYHLMFMKGLREQRKTMKQEGLVYAESGFPPSLILIVALALLALSVVTLGGMEFHVGPFG